MNVSIIKNELDEKMKSKFYHFLQVNFAYNSNRIEGSRLTKDETEAIFETNSSFCGWQWKSRQNDNV